MVKIVDHQISGKQKYIIGKGRKGDIPLEAFDGPKNRNEKITDEFLKTVKPKPTNLTPKTLGKIKNKIQKLNKNVSNIKSAVNYLAKNNIINNYDKQDILSKLDEISKKCMS